MTSLLRRCAVVMGCALVAASCAPRQSDVLLDTTATPPAELRQLVAERSSRLRSLQGSGAMSFDSPEMSGDAAFTTHLKLPDSLLVFLEGPFGIDVGLLFLSRERYVVYNGLENRVMTGNPSAGAFRSMIPFNLTYEQLMNAFAGVYQLPGEEPERYEIRDDAFFLSYACGASICEYWVDPALLLVTRFRRLNAEGGVMMEVLCSSPREDDGAAAPRKIVISFPEDRRRLSIAYARVSLNDPDVSFDYSIPGNAETIVR